MNLKIKRRQLLGLAAGAAAAATLPCASAQAPVTMKVVSATINDVIHHWMKTFKAAVETRSAGRIKVELYPASQLGAIPRMVEGTAMGTIECFVTASSFLTSLDPRFEVFDVPGLLNDTAHAARAFSDPEMRKLITGFAGNRGLESISMFMHSPQNVVSRKPIRTLADFNGQKIRVLSTPIQIEPLRKLNAAPIPMPLSEVMPALQNGAIDGFIAASTIFSALKFYDAAKFQTELPQWPIVAVAACNKAWLGRLPADLRTIVLEEAAKTEGPTNEFGAADIARGRDTWTKNGGQIIILSNDDSASFARLVNQSATDILKKSAPAKEAFDAYSALVRKHQK
jgi:TRAP-type C4-dicarboxylate transport system substrate-binding protein